MWSPKQAHVWAAQFDTPAGRNICADARLRGPSDLRRDEIFGQAGWNVGIAFQSLSSLALRLRNVRIPNHASPVSPGKIRRLAINAHGDPGRVYVDGRHSASSLGLETLSSHEHALNGIREMTSEGGAIYFMGCNVAAGGDGPELLRRLSEGSCAGASSWAIDTAGTFRRAGWA